ncbi:uncharacterized mitochondrial protein AtMg00860-like [Primulina eburnea]|uniref:uncharacterized mitochondrial protein AtMg00860-like n=1 Tax=Primulina eburnea TaxID=1245227 RepID=UPI003C6C539B
MGLTNIVCEEEEGWEYKTLYRLWRAKQGDSEEQPYFDQFIIVFIDDILIYSNSREEHSQNLKIALQTLPDQKLYAKFSKCEFWLERVVFLDHIISNHGVEVDPTKVEAVKEWSVPRKATEICGFLGLANYYRKFIKVFSSIAVPLTALTKKNVKFIWGADCQDIFDWLKQTLTTAPVLAMPSSQGDYVLYTNASTIGLAHFLCSMIKLLHTHLKN